jgi:hypothetical protein
MNGSKYRSGNMLIMTEEKVLKPPFFACKYIAI